MLKILKNQYFIAFIILLTAIVIAFSNIIFLGKTFSTSTFTVGTTRTGPFLYKESRPELPVTDGASSAWHFEPAMQLNSQAYRNGQLPLWNPYNGAGQPLAADMQSSSFYPLALPILLNPSPAMWDFFLLLRLFVAGLLTFIFLRLINLKVIASIAGAITFMLSGYLIFFVNMAHLNVEILIPLLLLSIELLYQRKNFISIGLLAISSALVIIGGMPESATVTFIFAGAYFVFRAYKEFKHEKSLNVVLKPVAYFSIAVLTGLIISAVSWAPFLEYSQLFWSKHIDKVTGGVALNPYFAVQYIAPRYLSPLHNTAYIGVIPLLLILGFYKKHAYKWFFLIAALIIGLKVFGIGINWIGFLPVLERVYLFKYIQAPLAFSAAVLTAIAIDSGLKTRWWRISLVGLGWFFAYYYLFRVTDFFKVNRIIRESFASNHVKLSIALLILVTAITLIPKVLKKSKEVYISLAVAFLIFIELWLHIPGGRANRFDPYIAPPFVKFLQQQDGLFRTYATDAVLWPNTNAAYKIQDIRSLNALQPMNYMTYLSLFSDLRKLGHVTGLEGVNLESQFLNALNVRYVLTMRPLQNNLDYWLERKEKVPATRIGEEVWYTSPFSAKLKFPPDVKYLNLNIRAQKPENFEITYQPLGNVIGLESEMKEVTGSKRNKDSVLPAKPKLLFKKKIRPGLSSEEIKISSLAGKSLKLSFSGRVFVKALHYSNGGDLNNKFKLVFTDNKVEPAVTIYENKKAMPRVVVYDKVKFANNNQLRLLKQLNIREKALVETPIKLTNKKKLKCRAKVVFYDRQKVKISVKTNKKSLLVLADTYYPGWKAYVDGVEKPIIKTNLMFRGVLIEPSSKEVIIAYKPKVYKTSFGLTGASMLAVVAISLSRFRRKKLLS